MLPSVRARFEGIPKFEIEQRAGDPDFNRAIPISRKMLTRAFGGKEYSYKSSWAISRPGNKQMTGLRLDWNPQLPDEPGQSGLLIRQPDASHDEVDIQSVFICVDGNVWLYCGDYRFKQSRPLTKEEWLSLEKDVRILLSTESLLTRTALYCR